MAIHTDLHAYSEALERFTDNGYFYLKDVILNTLADFQIEREQADKPLHVFIRRRKKIRGISTPHVFEGRSIPD